MSNQEPPLIQDEHYRRAVASIQQTLDKLHGCSADEKQKLHEDFGRLQQMLEKLNSGRVEIVVFGEISTGKSALINALIGEQVTAVDVRGGWTKEIWQLDWKGCGYVVPGLASSQVVLVDTPGLNEVGGQDRGEMAQEAARRADLILFVTDSDLNETEYSAIVALAAVHKPMLIVLNKLDLYSREQRERLFQILREERLRDIVPAVDIVGASADPREMEYVIEAADGSTRNEWRKPRPDVQKLKERILEVLERDGLSLLAINGAMYAADKSDRIASLRIQLRDRKATQTIWSYASVKALAVGLNFAPVLDIVGGTVVDATMVATLAHIYGLQMSWNNARQLVMSIVEAAGWVMLAEHLTHWAASTFKFLTFGVGFAAVAIPQGAAAGYGSYIVGQAAKYYFEHGASWGEEGPKSVVKRILDETDKQSVLERLKDEIRNKLKRNPHAANQPSNNE